jgi:hypothetical protein
MTVDKEPNKWYNRDRTFTIHISQSTAKFSLEGV